MPIKNYCRIFFRSCDLTRYEGGERILKVISYVLIVYVVCTGILLYIDAKSIPENRSWIYFFVAFIWTVNLGQLVLVWVARLTTNTRAALKLYFIWTVSLMPIMLPVLTTLKVYIWTVNNYTRTIEMILFVVFTSLNLFMIFNVIRIYKKLESTYFEKWKEFSEIKEVRRASIPNVRTRSVNTLTDKDFRKSVLNPLNLKIDSNNKIGEGQFGTVFKGLLCLQNKRKVEIAAKMIKNPETDEAFLMLLNEISLAIAVGYHENIVKLYGVSSETWINSHYAIILEYCEKGSLEKFLRDNREEFAKDEAKTKHELLGFSKQIASGMQHLASKKIVHGDLAARNVLLTSDLTVKVTDFGMSHKLSTYEAYIRLEDTEACLPWKWMAPETLKDLKFSTQSDVYLVSFFGKFLVLGLHPMRAYYGVLNL